MEKVQFQTNVGERVALKYATGVPKPALQEGYSDQVLFTLCDGRCMYLPVFAADLITRVHAIQPGEDFVLGKYEVKEGQKKFVRWRVDPLDPAPPETPLESNLRRSAEIANARKPGVPVAWPQAAPAPPPVRATRAPAKAAAPVSATPPRPQPRATPPTVPRPAAQPPPSPTPSEPPPDMRTALRASAVVPTKVPMERALLEFLLIAGRQTRAAEQSLGADGASVRFDNRDVAALATTMLINAFNHNWITWGGVK